MNLLARTPEFLVLGENAIPPSDPNVVTRVENSGEIPVGWLEASFSNIGESDVIVNGVVLLPGDAKDYTFIGKGREAITYIVGETGRLLVMYGI